MSVIGSVIRDCVFDYDIQDAEGFVIYPLAVTCDARKWQVRCGDATQNVGISMYLLQYVPNPTSLIKTRLQEAVDAMWSRWMAL